MAVLAELGILLGVCPTSDIELKVYSTMEAHPTRPASRRWGAGFDQHRRLKSTWANLRDARAAYGQTKDVLRDLARVDRGQFRRAAHQ